MDGLPDSQRNFELHESGEDLTNVLLKLFKAGHIPKAVKEDAITEVERCIAEQYEDHQ